METYSYKRLGIADTSYMHELRTMFAQAFDEDEVWNKSKPSDEYLTSVLADSHYIALVALANDNQVVGGLIAYVLPKIDREHNEIYLYDLAVAAEHRRRGIATQLITELKNIGKTYGASVIFVQADNVDTEAVALYEKLADTKETDISHFDIAITT